jgi:hypothetical protein
MVRIITFSGASSSPGPGDGLLHEPRGDGWILQGVGRQPIPVSWNALTMSPESGEHQLARLIGFFPPTFFPPSRPQD